MSRTREPEISVVTPFHNTAAHLGACIESVLAQTFENFEYVLRDNASTDGSSQIAARYAAQDPRIRLIRNDVLLPQVENYNAALRLIRPQSAYCKIVQADDLIFKNCLAEMLAAAKSSPSIALVGSYSLYEPLPGSADRTHVGNNGLDYEQTVLSGPECARRYLIDYLPLFGSPTCVMYRTRDVLARQSFYDTASPVEDVEACLELLKSGSFAFVHQVLSFNRREVGSFFHRHVTMDGLELNRVLIMHKFAAGFLSAEEAEAAISDAERKLYRAFGRALLKRRPKTYWDLHRKELARVGLKLDKARIARQAVRALLDIVGNPRMALGQLRREARHASA